MYRFLGGVVATVNSASARFVTSANWAQKSVTFYTQVCFLTLLCTSGCWHSSHFPALGVTSWIQKRCWSVKGKNENWESFHSVLDYAWLYCPDLSGLASCQPLGDWLNQTLTLSDWQSHALNWLNHEWLIAIWMIDWHNEYEWWHFFSWARHLLRRLTWKHRKWEKDTASTCFHWSIRRSFTYTNEMT